MFRIVEKRELTPITKLLRVQAPLIARAARPGQFIILRVRQQGERIPLTIADFDGAAGTVTIVVQEVGALRVGDHILDMLGPLGVPVEIPAGGHIVGVGGGFGAAALLCVMRMLSERGDNTTAIIGARRKDLLVLVEELRAVCRTVEVCTDDGSAGFRGVVTQRLQQLIDGQPPGRPDHVVAIGPIVMLRAVAETTRPAGIPTQVSLDPLMVDGTGMCGGCRVSVNGKTRFTCVDGPFFDAHKVDFDEAMRRSKRYVREEQIAAALQAQEMAAGAAHAR